MEIIRGSDNGEIGRQVHFGIEVVGGAVKVPIALSAFTDESHVIPLAGLELDSATASPVVAIADSDAEQVDISANLLE